MSSTDQPAATAPTTVQQQEAPAAAAAAAAALNINAKPFTPSFGTPAAANTNTNANNTASAPLNLSAPLPRPPMPPPGQFMYNMYNPMGGNAMMMGAMYQQNQNQQRMGGGYYPGNQMQQMPMMNMYNPAGANHFNNHHHGGHGHHHPHGQGHQQVTVGVKGAALPHNAGYYNASNHLSNPANGPSFAKVGGLPPTPSAAGGAVAATAAGNSPPAPNKRPPVKFPRKVAFLVLGGRGSGKTTQCEQLAKQYNLLHIAGGSFVAEKKLPLVELERVLGEHFVAGAPAGKAQLISSQNKSADEGGDANNDSGNNVNAAAAAEQQNNSTAPTPANNNSPADNNAPSTTATTAATTSAAADATNEYNGVILDRMIGLHEYDAYYLDAILSKFGLAVELVFLLMLDAETAGQRATARGDGKPVEHTRQMAEHRIQYAAVNTVYSPLKILHCVECDNMPKEAITRALDRVIETRYNNSNPATAAAMPATPQVPHHPYTQGQCKVVTNYQKFYDLRNQMLWAVHNNAKPPIVCPASLMSGIADRRMFASPKQAKILVNSYATLKADGQRVLLFKHAESGEIYGINGVFHFMYHFTPYFTQFGIVLPPKPEGFVVPEHGIEWVIDAECFSVEGKAQIAVFDYLYFYGNMGNEQLFETRLAKLTDFFGKTTIAPNATGTATLYGPAPLFLKQYLPAPRLKELLPDIKNPPFPIDGVVFQHMGRYKFGRDNAIYKWKPREQCTVDFRLDKSVDPMVPGGEWCFVPMVGEDKEEVPWPNAQVRATDADARRCDLCDGTIAECVKRAPAAGNATTANGGGAVANSDPNAFTIWDFVRVRPEKPTPNRMEIAKVVNSMEHMTFDELARDLAALGGSRR